MTSHEITKPADVPTEIGTKLAPLFAESPETAGDVPTPEMFGAEIEQPTIRQTIDPNAEAALRQQELAQRYMSCFSSEV